MLLSRDAVERHAQYRNLIRGECEVSRADRQGAYRRLRQIALTGSDTIAPALYNRIYEFLRDATADILSPDNIKFSISTPPSYGEMFIEECDAAREEHQRLWRESDAGLVATQAAFWARVYGTMVSKVLTVGDEATVLLEADPSNIGVYNESTENWSRQEAICHWHEADLSQFRRLIYTMDDKVRKRVWLEAEAGAQPPQGDYLNAMGPAVAGIVLSAVSPNVTGTANMRGSDPARAQVRADVVRLAELWVYDDEAYPLCGKCGKPAYDARHLHLMPTFSHEFDRWGAGWEGDYRVATVLLSGTTEPVIKEPLNPLLTGEHPFHGLTLHPVPGYIWGLSQVEQMYPLQEKDTQLVGDIFERLEKQNDPPFTAPGAMGGVFEEKIKALRKKGASVALPSNAKVEPFIVPMPPDAFSAHEEVSKMFDRLGGRRSRTREPGMRSGDQVMAEATLAGGAMLEEAKRAQHWLEAVATQMIRLHRRVSKTPLKKYNHEEQKETDFLLSQLPGDIVARIEMNSSSPIHKQEILAKVAFAVQHKAIDPDDLIELLGLPFLQDLKAKARRRARSQSEVQQHGVSAKVKELESKAVKNEAQALQAIVKAQRGQ